MRTNLSNCTREEFIAHFRELEERRKRLAALSEAERQKFLDEDRVEQEKLAEEGAAHLAEITGDPTILVKVAHYAVALVRWTKAKWPVRTDEEVATIIAICESCEHYNAKKQSCNVCGCKVSAKGCAIRSKARMKTETCAKGKWPIISSPSPSPT
jgi:hypothetical protein